jgi:hypothetical protein
MSDPVLTPAYAQTTAETGYGDAVFISIDGGTTFIQVMQTQNVQYSNNKKDFLETTTTTSIGGYKTYKGTLKDPGSFTFSCVVLTDDPGQLALASSYDADVLLTVKHVYKAEPGFTTGPINTFFAEVEQCPPPGSNQSDFRKIDVSLKISGPITTTPAVEEGD